MQIAHIHPVGFLALLLLIGGLLGWSAWQRTLRRPMEEAPVETPAMEPAERALWEAARQRPADADAQRELGLYLLEQRQPYEAMWAFQDALDRRSEDGEAQRGLARAVVAAQLPRLALKTLAGSAGASPTAPDRERGEARRVAAAAYLAMGDAVGAIGVLTASGPALDAAALLDLGTAYEAFGDDRAAAAAYRRHLQLAAAEGAPVTEGELALARLARRGGREREAVDALKRAHQAAPDDPRPMHQLGLPLLPSHSDYGPAHLQMGLRHLKDRRPEAAAASLERAAAAGAGGAETRLHLAEALQAAGRKAAAAYQRGAYFMETQQPHLAAREYQRMITLAPERPDAYLLLSTAHAKRDQLPAAAAAARQGLERHPHDPNLLARRAQLLLMTEERAAGAKLCREWIERDPAAAEPYRLLGSIDREERRFAEAVRRCEQATERAPQNGEYWRETARALVGAPTPANLRRAAAALRRAIALNDRDAEAHLQLGDVLQRLGDPNGALREYLRSVDRDPTERRAVVALSQLCPRLGQGTRVSFYGAIVRALQERETAARLLWRQAFQDPQNAEAHARLAQLLLEAGDLRQAQYQLEQTVRLRPDRKSREQLRIVERLLALREG